MNILKYLSILFLLIGLPLQVQSSEMQNKTSPTCKKHRLKLSECFICDKNLRVKGRLWCKGHNRYEDRCWDCHPDLQDKKRMYCKNHGLYEDECFFCHPDSDNAKKLKEQSLKTTAKINRCKGHGLDAKLCFLCDPTKRQKGRLWCKEHNRYEDRCWKCHAELEDKKRPYCDEHGLYEDECIFCNPKLVEKEKGSGKQCKGHGIDASMCFLCDPTKRQKGRLWCKEHKRYEDRCWMCHKELEDKKRPYCNEHGLYEDECIFCNPKASKKGASLNQPVKPLFCNEHQVSEHECGICQPQLAGELQVGESMKIRFASPHSVTKAGIKMGTPKESSSTTSIRAYSKVVYNRNAFAHISPLVSGVISKVLINTGDQVKKDQVIAKINSMEIAEAKRLYLTSVTHLKLKNTLYNRENKLARENASTARELEDAESAFTKALIEKKSNEQKLINYGFTKNDLAEIIQNSDSSSTLLIKAPFDGVIIDRDAVMGELKNVGDTLFKLCDLSNMWLEMSIPEDRISLVQKGQKVEAAFENTDIGGGSGKIIWIDTLIDEKSRMMKTIALIPNPYGQLKSGLFGYANIKLDRPKKSWEVPVNAVHELNSKPYVFVKVENDLFDMRRVQVSSRNNNYFYVTNGIQKNENIVVTGKFTMVSELLKSKLGAGCADH